MAVLINIHQLHYTLGSKTLFDQLSLSVMSDDRIALVGINGSGKSTLMKILNRELQATDGNVVFTKGLRVGYLPQETFFKEDLTVEEVIEQTLSAEVSDHTTLSPSARDEILSRLFLDTKLKEKANLLSGGWQKKLAIALELIKAPDVLLLDEPTNHLDIDSIQWLEEYLARTSFAYVVISHDRSFLNKTADKVIEIDRRYENGILIHEGRFNDFLIKKREYLENLQSRQESLSNTLRREEEWLGRGAKARTTKQQARIERALDLRDEVSRLKQLNQSSTMDIGWTSAQTQSRQLIELSQVGHRFKKGDVVLELFQKLDLRITSKTRLGLMGANGTGKTTLLKILLGQLTPTQGSVKISDLCEPIMIHQLREFEDEDLNIVKIVCPYGETVEFQGRKIHVRSYLSKFLFEGPQLETRVKNLSGGERARLSLAVQLLQPTNLLILDEPTNDLDLDTLEVLEMLCREFDGALILVSHDRSFMNEVCNQILGFPEMILYEGYDQWAKAREKTRSQLFQANKKAAREAARETAMTLKLDASLETSKNAPKPKKKLSFNEKRELEQMESRIQNQESLIEQIQKQLEDPSMMSHAIKLTELTLALSEAEKERDRLYQRWEELDQIQANL